MRGVSKESMENVIFLIRNSVNPQKIYLFGSYADGTFSDESDIDM